MSNERKLKFKNQNKKMASIRVKALCDRMGLQKEKRVVQYALEISRRASSRCRNLGAVRV